METLETILIVMVIVILFLAAAKLDSILLQYSKRKRIILTVDKEDVLIQVEGYEDEKEEQKIRDLLTFELIGIREKLLTHENKKRSRKEADSVTGVHRY